MLQYNGVSGCNPASHKICKNNAITMTVYKVPEVYIYIYTCESGKQIYITKMYYFLFVEVNSVVSTPQKPNILEIRYIAVQYSEDVFIYSCRVRVSSL